MCFEGCSVCLSAGAEHLVLVNVHECEMAALRAVVNPLQSGTLAAKLSR